MNARIHLIHIPDKDERLRAIDLFLDVPATRVRLPGNQMIVTNAHIQALQQAKIAFEYVYQTQPNGQTTTTSKP